MDKTVTVNGYTIVYSDARAYYHGIMVGTMSDTVGVILRRCAIVDKYRMGSAERQLRNDNLNAWR